MRLEYLKAKKKELQTRAQSLGKEDVEELKKILEEQNTGFYLLKARLFDKGKLYSRDNRRLIELENTLRVPVVEEKDKLSECLKIFAELSDMEKVIFLQRIGKISVSIEEIEN